ncbi:hypothetical protein PSAB6_70067 [Paraburkholderia sabiae]|nr:hypothetical protein PSAB6_70067 [Paraburkholderia sabiae]
MDRRCPARRCARAGRNHAAGRTDRGNRAEGRLTRVGGLSTRRFPTRNEPIAAHNVLTGARCLAYLLKMRSFPNTLRITLGRLARPLSLRLA